MILAVIVITACGNALVGDRPRPAVEEGGILLDAVERDGLVFKTVANGALAGAGAEVTINSFANQRLAGFDRADDFAAQPPNVSAPDDALIVRTANLELEVGDVVGTVGDARADIASLGGYVSGSDVFDQGERTWATVTYSVPVDRFVEAMAVLRCLSDKVVRESPQSQEVTAQVVDLDARITNLEASEEALVAIMDRTGRIDNVLAVQMRLEDVRGQIERLEAQRKSLAGRAANSTLSVTWFTPVAAVAGAQEDWSLAAEIDAALAQTVEATQRVAGFGVWAAVVGLPVIVVPLLLLLAVATVLRLRLRCGDGGDGTVTPTSAGAEYPCAVIMGACVSRS